MVPFLIYSAAVIALAVIIIGFSTLLGIPRRNPQKDTPYESGIEPTGGAQVRTAIPYYLIAIFFILFDVELIFLYPWAVRLHQLSWSGFFKAFMFLAFVAAGLLYIWLRGGLVWRLASRTSSETTSPSQN